MADIPGIIEGAHEGKGLGHQFLRHIERTRVLLLMIPVDSADPQAEYERLRDELAAYSAELTEIPFLVALTKTDTLGPDGVSPTVDAPGALGVRSVSSATRAGVQELLEALWEASRAVLARERAEADDEEWWTP
jgi:GTP-binding protein